MNSQVLHKPLFLFRWLVRIQGAAARLQKRLPSAKVMRFLLCCDLSELLQGLAETGTRF